MSAQPSETPSRGEYGRRQIVGLVLGPALLGLVCLLPTPDGLTAQAKNLVALIALMAVWWMTEAVPLAGIYLLLTWLYLAFVAMRFSSGHQPGKGGQALLAQRAELGSMSRGERVVMTVFLLTVAAWVFRADLVIGPLTIPGWSTWLGLEVHDGTIAVAAALLLFLIPIDLQRGQFVLDWAWAVRIPWDVLFLYGGGFALATGFRVTGLAEWLAGALQLLAVLPLGIMMLVLCLFVIFASEIASNTALASLLLPILAATAKGVDIHPYLLMLPATLAASCGFMLPVATPPNAVAFASGYVTAPQMLRVGLVLDVLGAILVTLAVSTLGRAVFALD